MLLVLSCCCNNVDVMSPAEGLALCPRFAIPCQCSCVRISLAWMHDVAHSWQCKAWGAMCVHDHNIDIPFLQCQKHPSLPEPEKPHRQPMHKASKAFQSLERMSQQRDNLSRNSQLAKMRQASLVQQHQTKQQLLKVAKQQQQQRMVHSSLHSQALQSRMVPRGIGQAHSNERTTSRVSRQRLVAPLLLRPRHKRRKRRQLQLDEG